MAESKDQELEKKLWQAADKMRSNMDAAEYKHVVLGLIFLKYISDSFEEAYKEISKDSEGDPEDKDEYLARMIFWVPPEARWGYIQKNARQSTIGKIVDSAMDAIERDNSSLKGVLPKNYGREALDKVRLGELIDLIGTVGLGDKESKSKDLLGKVYEYFLGQFADAEGKKGGQFYTPKCIVKLLVEMIEPYKGRVFDPCCGSGGMFVHSEKFVEEHSGTKGDIHIFGQESNSTTWRLCKMNLAIRGIDNKEVKWNNEGSFLKDEHKDLRADFILANPPFNDSDWKGDLLRDDVRWSKYGIPPTGNANFAWVQHFIYHLAPTGITGFVLANGSMSSNTSGEGEIRKKIIEDDLVDCMVALPSQLFYNTMIPACLWFLTRDKSNHGKRRRTNEILFIDARNMGTMIDRRHRVLTEEDIKKIKDTYHAWRGEKNSGKYEDIKGFCKSASKEDVEKNNFILTPGRYVGTEEVEDDGEPFEDKMKRLTTELNNKKIKLEKIKDNFTSSCISAGFHNLSNIPIEIASNETLENIAESIFDQIFNLDDKVELPKGWKISKLGTELKTILGGTPSRTKKEYWDGNINWINSGKVNEFRITEPSEKITELGLKNSATKLLPKGTIVLAITGATLGQYSRLEIDSCANQSVVGILESEKIPSEYIYFWIKKNIEKITSYKTGGAQQHINKNNIDDLEFLVPSQESLRTFLNLVSPLFEQISINSFKETLKNGR